MSGSSSNVRTSDRQRIQPTQAQRTADSKAAFMATLTSVGSSLDSDLQERADNIHANAKSLTKQEKDLQKETKQLSKHSDVLQKFVDKSKKDLEPYNDMPDLVAELEADLAMIEETLRIADEEEYESDRESAGAPEDHEHLKDDQNKGAT